MENYKVIKSDGVNGSTTDVDFSSIEEAVNYFDEEVRESEKYDPYLKNIREDEDWVSDYLPPQSHTYQIELQLFVDGKQEVFEWDHKIFDLLSEKNTTLENSDWVCSEEFYTGE